MSGDDRNRSRSAEDERDAPLSSLAERVSARRDRVEDEPESGLFERMDAADLDAEAVWDELVGAEAEAAAFDAGESAPSDLRGRTAADESSAGRDERLVDKRTYCQRCRFLSSPPEVACGHEGTEILEAIDGDRFRVRNCPMVGEDGPDLDRLRRHGN